MAFEAVAKAVYVRKAARERDFGDGFVCIHQKDLGFFDAVFLQKRVWRLSVQRFENTSEVLFAHLRDRGKLEDLKLCVAGMRFHILNRLVDPSVLMDIVLIHIKFLIQVTDDLHQYPVYQIVGSRALQVALHRTLMKKGFVRIILDSA